MASGPAFIDRGVFTELLAEVPRADGRAYEDVATIYGDMSRLVVAWLASLTPADINREYAALGWGGAPNARALNEAAKRWMREYREPSAASRE